MTEADFQKEDRDLDRELDHREELEREDIMSIAVRPWLNAVTRRAPQPVAALLDKITDDWEAA